MGITKDYLRFEHSGSCGCVASQNGAVVALTNVSCAVTACEAVHVYNLRTADKIGEVCDSTKPATCLKLSSDKKWLAIGYSDGAIRLYDRESENPPVVFMGHRKAVNCLEFSTDGLTLASGGKDCTIILWDIVAERGLYRLNGHKDSVTQLQFVRNDQILISSSKDSFVKFWSCASQSCFYTIAENQSEIYSFALLRDESILVVATAEVELIVFELNWIKPEQGEDDAENKEPDTKKALTEKSEGIQELGSMANNFVRVNTRGKLLRQGKGRALQLVLSPDGKLLLCLGSDRAADFYRVFSEEETKSRITKKLKKAKKRAASEGDSSLVVTEDEIRKDVTILLSRIGDLSFEGMPSKTKFKCVDFSHDNAKAVNSMQEYKMFALTSTNSVLWIKTQFDPADNKISSQMLANMNKFGHRHDVRGLSVSNSNNAIVSCAGDELIVWSTHSLRPIANLSDEEVQEIVSVMFTVGDEYIITGSKDGSIGVWKLATTEMLESRTEHEGAIWALVELPDKSGFISASADKKVIFWTYQMVTEGTRKRMSVKKTKILELPDEALGCSITPNGKFLIVSLLNNTASVYFLDTLKFFVSLYGHSLPVTCVSSSPDSKLCVTGSADKSVKIWGLDFGDCHKSFHAHDDVVTAVMFMHESEEDVLFWSAGKDGKIKQWDAKKFRLVQTLDRHSAEIRAIVQTSNSNLLFSASHDKSLRCWQLTEEIIVLEEEEEMQREEDYERKLGAEEDAVPGESTEAEAGLATIKTSNALQAAENIIEAVDIVRNERVKNLDPNNKEEPHILIKTFNSKSLDHFILDTLMRARPSELERALLLVPFSHVHDILLSLSACAKQHYKVEFASRTALFLIKIHVMQLVATPESATVVEQLRKEMMQGIEDVREKVAFNFAALKLLQLDIEESSGNVFFSDLSAIDKKKANKKKQRKAIVKTIV
ncbi:hypothetical protein WR25_20927 [Diploscapter pachys]|uniref:Small-subunit processome Utp12 domain-containing protein n=1 Tax=Diploscapter pachys TaxID=2018661 RepID=A0A2A2KAP6_9BILA|nr:hypothetical protein WR25_20927 [Diploscapter pachys]